VLGVGIGAYREEFEAMQPAASRVHRGEHAEEAIAALRRLFTDRRASFHGKWVEFTDIESYPQPVQERLPLLSGGNSPGSRSRAARLADGWLPACLSAGEVRSGLESIRDEAEQHRRRLPDDFDVALQVCVSVAPTREQAWRRFESSQLFRHLMSLSKTTLKDQGVGDLLSRNLIGTPEDVAEQVQAYREAGVTTMAALLFAADSVPETLDAMAQFSAEVIAVTGGEA
jgi:alkanesulfonate monooxygenase SsuD/methylene tetrahydromethanopterin reductase-like flavin-dependent oxidoreductase (luciferase family)